MHQNQVYKKYANILENFYNTGVFALNDKQIISQINNFIKDTISVHIKNVKKIDPSARTLSNCVEGFRRKQNPVLFDKISDSIFSNNVFKEIHKEFFNKKNAPLRYVLMHYNQENDIAAFKHGKEDLFDDDLNFYHHDTNLNTLKVMVYLSSLKKIENGAFEYVEGSNHIWNYFDFIISRVNRKLATYRRDLDAKKKLMMLPNFFRRKNEFTDFSKDSRLGQYIKSRNKSFFDDKNIIIFDPLGIHRGGRVIEGERIALQLVFSLNDYAWRII